MATLASFRPNEDEYEMVQTYGVAQEDESLDPTNHVVGEGEGSALLGDAATAKRLVKRDGNATIISCVSNLANTIIGSGEL